MKTGVERSLVIKAFIILLIYNQMVLSQQNITSFVRAKSLFLVYTTFQLLNSYGWTVTIALVDNHHSPQNKTVMTVGHFLIQFLCPASKIRTEWGGASKTSDNVYYTCRPPMAGSLKSQNAVSI